MTAISSNNDLFDAPQATLTDTIPEINTSIWSIKGRLGVLQYNSYALILMLAICAPLGAAFLLSGMSLGELTNIEALSGSTLLVLTGIAVVALLPMMWIGTTLFIRRLHDLNMNGWYALVGIIPLLGSIFTLYVICMPGKEEANRFGDRMESVGWEKGIGIIGLLFFVAITIVSVIPM